MKPKRQKPKKLGTQVASSSPKLMRLPGSIELLEMERMLLADVERRTRLRRGSTGDLNSLSSRSTSASKSTGTLKAFRSTETDKSNDPPRNKYQEQLYRKMGYLDYANDVLNVAELMRGGPRGQASVGGVMTDQVQAIPGRRVIATTSTSGSPPTTTVSTSVQGVTAFQKILDNVASVDGNRRNPNPHRFRVKRIDYGGGRSFAGDGRNNTTISGTQALALGLSATTTDLKTFTYNKCLSKVYEKLRGDTDLSVDAFQARQSGVMLNQRFQQGRDVFLSKAPKALLAVVDITKRMRRSNPRDWGSLWLEWTYGWKPLAGSVYGAAENMILASAKSSSGVSGHPIRVSASEVSDWRTTKVTIDGVSTVTEIERLFQCRITGFWALTTGGLNSVANYTSLNPVSIAWELVPYSFVADWFLDIGGYLRNLESSLLYNSDFTGGYSTERSKETIRQSVSGGHQDYSVDVKGSVVTKEFQRKVLTSSPSPHPPSFNPKLGVERLTNAAALLSQMLHSLKHKR